MRSISDYLAAKFQALGIPEITDQQLHGGKQVVTFGDGTRIFVGPFASDTEIESAARQAFRKPEEQLPDQTNETAPTADRIPVIDLAPSPAKQGKPIPTSGAFVPGSLKAILQGIKDRSAVVMSEAVEEAKKVHAALDKVVAVKSDLTATHQSIMAELGQFSNMADEE